MRVFHVTVLGFVFLCTGARADNTDQFHSAEKNLPPIVVWRVKAQFPNAELVHASKERENGAEYFEIRVLHNGYAHMVFCSLDAGQLASKRVITELETLRNTLGLLGALLVPGGIGAMLGRSIGRHNMAHDQNLFLRCLSGWLGAIGVIVPSLILAMLIVGAGLKQREVEAVVFLLVSAIVALIIESIVLTIQFIRGIYSVRRVSVLAVFLCWISLFGLLVLFRIHHERQDFERLKFSAINAIKAYKVVPENSIR
jgi:hypothetical protein